jgi:ParE toxin of type II toxin-antitoxin system, parDE
VPSAGHVRCFLPILMSPLREYLHGNYLMLYTAMEDDATVVLLSIRHHRQFSFDFARLWHGA